MQKKSRVYLAPQLVLILVISILFLSKSGYFPLNALRSIQTVRVFNSGYVNNNSITEVNILKQAIAMSPGNCDAYATLGWKYIEYAFPENNTHITYSSDLRQRHGNYDKLLSAEMLNILDSGLSKCTRDELDLRFLKGSIYYLTDQPYLAIQELTVYRKFDPYDKSQAAQAYEIMSESYTDLKDPLNAAIMLIFSLSEKHKDNVSEDINKIKTTNGYLESVSTNLLPNRNAGIGRYATATKINGQIRFLGALSGNPSVLIYSQTKNGNIFSTGEVLDAGNILGGNVALDRYGNTHIAYLLGNRYIVYANSKDEFADKIIIDTQITTPRILDSIDLAIDQNNQPHLTWSYKTDGIGYTVIKDGKADKPTLIANNSLFPSIRVSNNNSVNIVYNNRTYFPAEITQVWYLEKKSDSWGKPVQISQSNMWAGAASMIISDDGELHVFYITGSSPDNMELMHVVRDVQGNWQMPEVVGSQYFRPFNPAREGLNFAGRTAPSATLLSGNRIAVVWRGSFVDGHTEIYGREYADGEWKQIQILGEITGQDYADTQSVILKNDNLDVVSLVWSNNGELIFYEWKP